MRLSPALDQFPETDITTETLYYGADSLDLSFAIGGKCYDVFKDHSASLIAGPSWITSVARDLEVMADGETIVNATSYAGYAAGELELIGGFRCHADGLARSTRQSRLIWSFRDAIVMPVCRIDTTDSWIYSAAQWRQANNNPLNQIEIFCGVSGRMVDVTASAYMINGTSSVVAGFVGIGLDTSSVDSAQVKNPAAAANAFPVLPAWARYAGYVGIGYHELRWLERGNGGLQTWFGDGGQACGYQTGIIGSVVL